MRALPKVLTRYSVRGVRVVSIICLGTSACCAHLFEDWIKSGWCQLLSATLAVFACRAGRVFQFSGHEDFHLRIIPELAVKGG
jgi:hypothetical protein